MGRIAFRVVVALALVGLGWTAGRAQQGDVPDFQISVQAPPGTTTIECHGCDLFWIERATAMRPKAPNPKFTYGCSGGGATQCPSGMIAGYIRR
jgi:hypothetical protein